MYSKILISLNGLRCFLNFKLFKIENAKRKKNQMVTLK